MSNGLTTEPQSTEASRTDRAEQKWVASCVGRVISVSDCSLRSLMVAEISEEMAYQVSTCCVSTGA